MGAQNIYTKLKAAIGNDYGVCGLMGNLKAESGMQSNNLQNTYEKSLSMTDAQYTKAVDDGSYTNFVNDKAGYGLAQWTYYSRKQNLLNYAKQCSVSIGDEDMQIAFLIQELKGYKTVWATLVAAASVKEASDIVLTQFEKPANQSDSVKSKRASYGEEFYNEYCKEVISMSNSSLVDCTVKSPNHSGVRTHSIDRITPHCVVGQLSAESIGGCFTSSDRQASCNYGIGKDGRVVLCVDEANRSWCSSSNTNDQRAVTIECASDSTDPYAFNDAVYAKLIELCTDICQRNGKVKLLWLGDKDTSLNYEPAADEMVLTVHRWFANKSCPGDWMYNRMSDLANSVTAKLSGSGNNVSSSNDVVSNTTLNTNFPTVPFTVQVIVSDLNYRSEGSMSGIIKGQTGKGTFTIVEVNECGWGKLKSGAGWIYLENSSYVTIGESKATTTVTEATTFPYKVKVTISDLNIRKGPGTNYGKNGICPPGVYNITEESDGKGATKWGKLKSGAGWISLDYASKV